MPLLVRLCSGLVVAVAVAVAQQTRARRRPSEKKTLALPFPQLILLHKKANFSSSLNLSLFFSAFLNPFWLFKQAKLGTV